MLSAIFLGVLVTRHVPVRSRELLTANDVAARLGNAGYEFQTRNADHTEGTIARDGARVEFKMLPEDLSGEPVSPNDVGLICLRIEIPTGEDVTLPEAEFRFGPKDHRSDFASFGHLGRSATLTGLYYTYGGTNIKRLESSVEGFWTEGRAYAERHRGRFENVSIRDWSKVRFDESLVLRYSDPTSYERLMASWGYRRLEHHESVTRPDEVVYLVGGKAFTLGTESEIGGIRRESFDLSPTLWLTHNVDFPDPRTGRMRHPNVTWKEMIVGDPGILGIHLEVANGVTLGVIHRRIEAIERAIAAPPPPKTGRP